MCEPTTILGVTSAVSTLAQGYAARQQGRAADRQGQHQNAVAQYNARVAENEATRIRNKGTDEELRFRQQTQQLISQQRAGLAASGVDIDSGSPLQLQADAELIGEADALRIRSNFSDEARVRDDQAQLTRYQGEAAEIAGKNARAAGNAAFAGSILSAGGTLLSAGVADKWFAKDSMALGGAGGSHSESTIAAWLKRQR